MKNWQKSFFGFGMVALSLTLVACSSGQTNDSKAATDETAAPVADDSTFTYAIGGDPSSTNPINTSDRWGLTVTNIVYSPLIVVEGDGSTKNALAESVEPAKDGLSLTVHLKEDVKWSDGEDFTADDVVFTYEQKAKKENGNADQLWVDEQPIKFEKVDDYTVKFVLPSASAAALQNIATETYIIPEHIFKDVPDFSVSELPEQAGDIVDVTGTTKGKGFQGVIKRHGQSRGPMAHGSRYHRRPGSMGPVAPNRVFKNKRLAGRMGGNRVTIQNLEIVRVDAERNVILIKGNVPGAKKSLITIKSAVKAK